jgi:maltooligosyltrehalose trehalohydrolase
VQAVRRGRSEEFSAFRWQGEVPDPQAESTFRRCILDHSLAKREHHRSLREFYRELIRLRRGLPAIDLADKRHLEVRADTAKHLLLLLYEHDPGSACVLLHFGAHVAEHVLSLSGGEWRTLLDSADARWAGPGRMLPERVVSHSPVTIRLHANSVIVLSKQPIS